MHESRTLSQWAVGEVPAAGDHEAGRTRQRVIVDFGLLISWRIGSARLEQGNPPSPNVSESDTRSPLGNSY